MCNLLMDSGGTSTRRASSSGRRWGLCRRSNRRILIFRKVSCTSVVRLYAARDSVKIHHDLGELAKLRAPVYLAIGVFDGVHLGHQALLRAACEDAAGLDRDTALSVAMTFDPPPTRVLRPKSPPPLLTSLAHKIQRFGSQQVKAALVQHFDLKFAAIPPRAFLHQLHDTLGGQLREICVGHNFRFGHNRAGDAELIFKLGGALGFAVKVIQPIKIGDEIVSSTAVRRAIAKGDLEIANAMLGRSHAVFGKVGRGSGRGAHLGFPTANVTGMEEMLPPNGVYAVNAFIGRQSLAGERVKGVANLGVRPTFEASATAPVLEIHLFDFDDKIYGEPIAIEFIQKIRDERKFASATELKSQIERDIAKARAEFR